MRTKAKVLLAIVAAVVAPCGGFFWTQPLKCYNATWTGRGQACRGTYTGRTCARSHADLDAYLSVLESTLQGSVQQCIDEFQDRLPPCPHDETQLTTPEVLNTLCCSRGSTCSSDDDCEKLESLSGYHVRPSTVLELGGGNGDFIAIPKSNSLVLTAVCICARVPLCTL